MSIVRMIYVKVKPEQQHDAEKIWKDDCAPLMIKQPGCLSEQLLKCIDVPGEYISYSEWESESAIDKYRKSKDHDTIVQHARRLTGAKSEVKRYHVGG